MPRCRPKDNTDKFGENPNITLIQIEYLILGMPAAAAKSLQSCQTLCDPVDGSLPGSLGIHKYAYSLTHTHTHYSLQG